MLPIDNIASATRPDDSNESALELMDTTMRNNVRREQIIDADLRENRMLEKRWKAANRMIIKHLYIVQSWENNRVAASRIWIPVEELLQRLVAIPQITLVE